MSATTEHTFIQRDPATGAVRGTLNLDDAAAVAGKVAATRAAQPAWAALPFAERAKPIRAFRDLIIAELDRLATVQSTETGKPIAQARNELRALPARIDFFLENAERVLAPSLMLVEPADGLLTGKASLEERVTSEPLGVIANISAWNYPWFVGANVFIPALLAGNAVAYKPSEFALDVGFAIGDLFARAGLPSHVFTVIAGAGEAGRALLAQPIDGVFFTGSHATGARIAQAVADRLIPVQLELGGKDPAYVADDFDAVKAAGGLADGAFYNNGQSCCGIERIYVHAAVYDTFVEAFLNEVKGFVMGAPSEGNTYLGPLTREAQIAVLDAQVADAVSKGATLRTGGARAPGGGWYYQPTVLTEVDHTMEVMREESFGPIIGIQKVANDTEAAHLMADTAYGLTAAVYSADRARAVGILKTLDTGTAYWNCCDRVSPRLPWTGRGHSGVGSTLGEAGIRAFTRPRAWHLRGV